jgi:hypothetical protein
MSAPSIPTSLETARPQLRLRLYGRVFHAVRAAELEAKGAAEALPGTLAIAGDVLVSAAVDIGEGVVPVTQQQAADWGVGLRDVVDAALQNGFGRDSAGVQARRPGTYVVTDEQLGASLTVRPSMLGGFPVKGAPVLLAPGRGAVIVTGSDDPEGLQAAVQIADEIAGSPEGLVTAVPLVLRSDWWEVFDWPAEPALLALTARLSRRFAAAAYAYQATLFAEASAYPASAKLFQAPDGRVVLVASWTRGQETLLPVVDDVVVVSEDGTARKLPFAQVVEAPGVTPTDLVPQRYHVRPDAEL